MVFMNGKEQGGLISGLIPVATLILVLQASEILYTSSAMPSDFDKLAARMIDEMGIDRHMEEILRVVDQREMTDEQFMNFLKERGYPEEEEKGFKKGLKDITVYTGPHLGGFNQRISVTVHGFRVQGSEVVVHLKSEPLIREL